MTKTYTQLLDELRDLYCALAAIPADDTDLREYVRQDIREAVQELLRMEVPAKPQPVCETCSGHGSILCTVRIGGHTIYTSRACPTCLQGGR